ncbi:MAG: carbohydrate ABC transporter permease [Clostridia bacterium]|nr:carbohydrate ABC transporter permease [Clostridia bacterium]
MASISDPNAVAAGETMLLPKGVSFLGYAKILEDSRLVKGFINSVIITVLGTSLNMFMCLFTAFALSRKELPRRRILNSFFVFTMYFSGGLIPAYLLHSSLGTLNTFWALILPGLNVYNMIICRSFFQSNVSEELFESIKVDGGSYFTFFFKIVLPLSKAIIAVMVLYHALTHWNNYMSALYYLQDSDKFPLQLVLKTITDQLKANSSEVGASSLIAMETQKAEQLTRYSVVIISSIPVFLLYPFIQKYFVKGVMVGSVKG